MTPVVEFGTSSCLKKDSISSRPTNSKNSDNFLLHEEEAGLVGFFGAGGQLRISGIICWGDFGVWHSSSSLMQLPVPVVLSCDWITAPPSSVLSEDCETLMFRAGNRISTNSWRNSRSVDMGFLSVLSVFSGGWRVGRGTGGKADKEVETCKQEIVRDRSVGMGREYIRVEKEEFGREACIGR